MGNNDLMEMLKQLLIRVLSSSALTGGVSDGTGTF